MCTNLCMYRPQGSLAPVVNPFTESSFCPFPPLPLSLKSGQASDGAQVVIGAIGQTVGAVGQAVGAVGQAAGAVGQAIGAVGQGSPGTGGQQLTPAQLQQIKEQIEVIMNTLRVSQMMVCATIDC